MERNKMEMMEMMHGDDENNITQGWP